MRNYLLLLFIACSTGLIGQEDLQWLVRNQHGKIGVSNLAQNNYPPSTVSYALKISGVSDPRPTTNSNKPFKNVFFAILETGEFCLVTCDSPHHKTLRESSGGTIEYLYLTNTYEEDDPPEAVKVSGGSTDIPLLISPYTTNVMMTNQDIVNQKDLVFIIPEDCVDQPGRYNLCHDAGTGMTFTLSDFDLDVLGSALLNGITPGSTPTISSNCVELQLSADNHNYLNLRSSIADLGLIGSSVKFTLSGNNGNVCEPLRVSVSGKFHDPNYAQLDCVWEDDAGKWAKYHVECFNEGDDDVEELSMTVGLPSAALQSEVKITRWMANCTGGRCGIKVKYPVFESSNLVYTVSGIEGLTVYFPSGLSSFNSADECCYTGWFEFCVKLNEETLIRTDPLTLYPRVSNFDGIDYPIVEYRDENKRGEREPKSDCGECICEQKIPIWHKLE